jgi:molybdate transport system substrate-binding protein
LFYTVFRLCLKLIMWFITSNWSKSVINLYFFRNYRNFQLSASILLLLFSQLTSAEEQKKFVLAAANSTCTTVQEIGKKFSRQRGIEIKYICKSSGRLAKGMMGKSIMPDYYISANKSWVDKVVKKGLIQRDVIFTPWGNRLVVAGPAVSTLALNSLSELSTDSVKRLMIGDPSTAPFGRYAKQALSKSAVWEQIRKTVTTRKHITLLANELAVEPDGSIGILFATNVNPPLKTILQISEDLHEPIRYFAGPVSGSPLFGEALAFSQFLKDQFANSIAQKNGFIIIP